MAKKEHLQVLYAGEKKWNLWRKQYPRIKPDLSDTHFTNIALAGYNLKGADLRVTNLSGQNLSETILCGAELYWANLRGANLSGTNLENAILYEASLENIDFRKTSLNGANFDNANLTNANFSGMELFDVSFENANLEGALFVDAVLEEANFKRANLASTDLRRAKLGGAIFDQATLINTNLMEADISDSSVYGVSAWDVKLKNAQQTNLSITPEGNATITVDNLEVAQFIYLILHNEKIREVIDTMTSTAVLILGRFTKKRLKVLTSIQEELRKRNYLPILYNFEGPRSKTTMETVGLLARLVRFVIADLTDAKSVLQELREIVPNNPTTIVQPIIQQSQQEPGMIDFFRSFPWFLEIRRYGTSPQLIEALGEKVIGPAEIKVKELIPQ